MKKTYFILFTLIFALLVGCSNSGEGAYSTTVFYASMTMDHYIHEENYEAYKNMFLPQLQESVSKETFEQLKEIQTTNSRFGRYELITYGNGEMVLVQYRHVVDEENEARTPEIVSVQIVPDTLKHFFNEAN